MQSEKKTRGIRLRITGITVVFTFVICLTFSIACYFLFRSYARASVLRSAEFNLQLVAHVAQLDLSELNSIASRQALDQSLRRYMADEAISKTRSLAIYEDMMARANSSSAYLYLQRFLAANGADRIIQVYTLTNSAPLNTYTLHQLPGLDSAALSVWQSAFHDPLLTSAAPDSLLTIHPIRSPYTGETAGVVYLTASVRLFSDRLSGYGDTPAGGSVYLRTGEGMWRIEGDRLTAETPDIVYSRRDTATARSPSTVIQDVRMADGTRYAMISCPVGGFGLSLVHLLPAASLFPLNATLWLMLAGFLLPVTLMGVVLFLYLNHLIVRPIEQLQARILRIAGGDFSPDPGIEWTNELGDIGRGVNRLSHDVAQLMERRIADEQARHDLEYKMLQSQVNPHFIYNTLNSIKWMATIQGASGISEMTTAFARLLKSVAKGNRPLHTLREEFALLHDYCTIQRYRYGGTITVEIAEISDEALCECMIPSFTLQPLVENSIFHGIEPKGGAGCVWLRICRESGDMVRITVEDDGVGMTAEAIEAVFSGAEKKDEKYSQIGLRNVHRRIQHAFGETYGLSIQSEPGAYMRVEIRIPYTHTKKEPSE